MKVLIADKFEQLGLDELADSAKSGCEVFFEPGLSADALPDALTKFAPDILIVRSTKVTAAAIEAGERLSLIIRAGAGYDTIDIAKASTEGVFVANCPGKNAIAVAELTWALILSCDRRVPQQTAQLRDGKWNKKEFGKANGVYGRTLGVLGLGTIAREVVTRAKGFGMNVVAWSRSLNAASAAEAGVTLAETPRRVAELSDIVSIHVASTAETKHLVDSEFIAAMKPGAYLINTSRGAVVDQEALVAGIRDKGIRAGLDVYDNEPGSSSAEFATPVAEEATFVGTHHVGASTEQAQQAIAMEAVRVINHYRDSGEVLNCVNRAARSTATCVLTVRHRNRPGVLAHVFQVLSEASINVEEMENVLYEGAEAACARIQLGSAPSAEHLDTVRARCADILSMELSLLGVSG